MRQPRDGPLIALVLVFLGSMFSLPRVAHASSLPDVPTCTGLRWIVNAGSLHRSLSAFPLAQQQRSFDSPCTFLVTGPKVPADYRSWSVVRTRSTPALAGLDRTVDSSGVAAVLYDPETWPMTPYAEQTDPVAAVCRAAVIAHAHGKLLIATPAVDLLRRVAPNAGHHARRYRAFEQTGWIGAMARCADVIEIQAQGAEANLNQFERFVSTEARQARAANPDVLVMAGISTNPNGQRVSTQQLLNAVRAVRSVVNGFWLNIPAGGKYCPRCGVPQPRVAVQLLQTLEAAAGAVPASDKRR